MTRLCRRCWHERDSHEHYSVPAQTWCSLCPLGTCPRFRWVAWPWNRGKTPRPTVADGAEAWLSRETGRKDAGEAA
jgi:hypothetical protein